MGPISKDPNTWLAETRVALRAIAKALGGRAATPSLLESLSAEYESSIPDHSVRIEWYPHGYMFLEERGQPAWPAEYGLLISGKRLISGWLIAAADIDAILGLASDPQD